MKTIKAECSSCRGTGLYVGFTEIAGTAAVCGTCDGTGCELIVYKPFVRRKGRRNIKKVVRSWRNPCKPVTYKDFLAGARPTAIEQSA